MDNPREKFDGYNDTTYTDQEKTKVVVSIPSNAVGTLVGPQGQTIEKLERETSCFLQVLRGERFSPGKHNKNHKHRQPLTDVMIQSWGDASKIQSCIERLSSLLMGMVAIRKVYPAGVSGLDCHYVKIFQGMQCARDLNGPTKDNFSTTYIGGQRHYTAPTEVRSEFIIQTPWRYSDLQESVIANLEKRTKYRRGMERIDESWRQPKPKPAMRAPQPTGYMNGSPMTPKMSLRDRRNMGGLEVNSQAQPQYANYQGQPSGGVTPQYAATMSPMSPMTMVGNAMYSPYYSTSLGGQYGYSSQTGQLTPGATVLTLPYSQAGYSAQASPPVTPGLAATVGEYQYLPSTMATPSPNLTPSAAASMNGTLQAQSQRTGDATEYGVEPVNEVSAVRSVEVPNDKLQAMVMDASRPTGISWDEKDQNKVASVENDSQASRLGVHAGAVCLTINDMNTVNTPVADVLQKISSQEDNTLARFVFDTSASKSENAPEEPPAPAPASSSFDKQRLDKTGSVAVSEDNTRARKEFATPDPSPEVSKMAELSLSGEGDNTKQE